MTVVEKRAKPHLDIIREHHARLTAPVLVASDLDNTLVSTKHHVRSGRLQELTKAARGLDLLIITGRRAVNPELLELWNSGLIPPEKPVITENGGVLVYADGRMIDLIDPGQLPDWNALGEFLIPDGDILPADTRLVQKIGRTMIVLAVESKKEIGANGKPHRKPEWQRELAGWLASCAVLEQAKLRAADGADSVVVQPEIVNKAFGLERFLASSGISRQDIHVTATGDAENDREGLTEADFAIGFSPVVKDCVHVVVPGGAAEAPEVLRAIRGEQL